MAQFDVHRMAGGSYALDCQSDLLSHLKSRFTVPLRPTDGPSPHVGRLHPRFEIDGKQVVMATHLAGAVPTRALGEKVGSLAEHDLAIKNALDMLISGY